MKTVTLSVLLAAAAMFAGAAHAQDAPAAPGADAPAIIHNPGPAEPQWSGDSWRHVDAPARSPFRPGLKALEAGDFARAEEFFSGAVRRKPRNPEANFYLGATRMDLGEWEAAKPHLEFAARKIPKHPDPKSRLGVTYARLGDTAGAATQRAALVEMAAKCKDTCKLAPYITAGIEMIDEALAPSTKP